MTALIAALVFLAIWAAAAIVSIVDPKPTARPREWTVGAMLRQRD